VQRVALETEQHLLDLHLLLGVERYGSQLAVLRDRRRRIEHTAVIRACGREHEARDTGRLGVRHERGAAADVDVVRELRVARARRIADDGSEVHDRADARERRSASGAVAHVALDHLDAFSLEFRRDGALAVEQPVEHTNTPAGGDQLAGGVRADVSCAARDQNRLVHVPRFLLVSG
jgi:hypothetical protein